MSGGPRDRLRIDVARARAAMAGRDGSPWRGLEEIAGTPEFEEFLHREFPHNASEWLDPAGRRDFLRLMAASLALAGFGACTRQPAETIVPYVQPPEEIVPGKPLYFATAMTMAGYSTGLLVESHMGRPTKVEGNPGHPASLGATDHFAQASVLTLYDPDRSQVVTHRGAISTWNGFLGALAADMQLRAASRGAGLRILTEQVGSPTLASLLRQVTALLPEARWHQYEPFAHETETRAARTAFGAPLHTWYRPQAAGVILSLDADLIGCGPGSLRYAREIASRRRAEAAGAGMSRLYVVESGMSVTGSVADHRLALAPSEIERFARALAAALGVIGPGDAPGLAPAHEAWLRPLAADLQRARGSSLVAAGPRQPAAVHVLTHAINERLGNVGATVIRTDPVLPDPDGGLPSLQTLVQDMDAGKVDTLIVIGGNPAYTAPAGLGFAASLSKVKLSIRLGLYDDETSALCGWHLPEAHFLEAWGDGRAFDGTAGIQQPLIAPLYSGRSAMELISAVLGRPGVTGHALVREQWRRARPEEPEASWRRWLHDGVIDGTRPPPRDAQVRAEALAGVAAAGPGPAPPQGDLEVVFLPDHGAWDGAFSNNGWLQELPRPITKLTWDNAALIAPATAERLGLASEDLAELTLDGRAVRVPVWIVPGMAPGAVELTLGYGRRRAGRIGTGPGYDACAVLPGSTARAYPGAALRGTRERYPLACTQTHHSMEGRGLVRWAPLSRYAEQPDFAHHQEHGGPGPELSMYREWKYDGYAWGMAIDLGACHGCNACVTACQSENNIPVVGKEQVMLGREMHWIRVDRYFEGSIDDPMVHHQPLPCMHCEHAPCEVVCPVAATTHSDEGLNQMVYNRCVGTRYCSNNCPYKVRRFNFLLYSDWTTPSLKMLRNPDVTVRSRGVMEKCTYCVQRINAARIDAKNEDRRIRDGEVTPACAQACPAQAIVFGDLNDPGSRVRRLKEMPLEYGLLDEINTRPRTTYLARVTNPHPEMPPPAAPEAGGHGEP
ncbi:MAG TPA: TAT-variant-translocated molybdopterin oxidoreductase [Candidatus Polarisedimenticolia bacterium]|nr:TAT-variant-translocated molybdopterin oxidoreductase [Candidatus Polarisedimenticolia bacterium]